MSKVITTNKKQYPNGEWYTELFVCGEKIGNITGIEGSYLVQGRRKTVPTLKDCAKQLIDAEMNKCMKKHEDLRRLLRKAID